MSQATNAVVLAVLTLVIGVLPAAAEREVVVTQLPDLNPIQLDVGTAIVQNTEPCVLGNQNPAAFAIAGWLAPPERYKLVVDPSVGCSNCPLGMKVHTIHMLLQTDSPCTLIMSLDVEAVAEGDDPNLDPRCPGSSPGGVLCESALYQVNIPGAGLWNIALPVECECFRVGSLYLLGIGFESVDCDPVPDLVTDGSPTNCTSWNFFNDAWADLVADNGFPGNLMIWADAECCTPPTQVEPQTWGEIKGTYRR